MWSIEFNVGDSEENESVMLHIRGGKELTGVLKALVNDLRTRLIDCSTGEFMELGTTSSFCKVECLSR